MSTNTLLVLLFCLVFNLKTSLAQRFLPPPPPFLRAPPPFRPFPPPPPFFRPNFAFPPFAPRFVTGGLAGIPRGITSLPGGLTELPGTLNGIPAGLNGIPAGFNGIPAGFNGIPNGFNRIPNGIPVELNGIPAGLNGINADAFGLQAGINRFPGAISANGLPPNGILNPPFAAGGVLGTANNDILNTGPVLNQLPTANALPPQIPPPTLTPNTIAGPIPSFPAGGISTPTFPIPTNAVRPGFPVNTSPIGTQNTVLTDPLTGSPIPGVTSNGIQTPALNTANNVPGIQFAGTNTFQGTIPGPTFPQTGFTGNLVPNTGTQQFATGGATNPFGLAGNTPSLAQVDGVATQVTSNVNQDNMVLNAGNSFSNRFTGPGNIGTENTITGEFNSIGAGQFGTINSTQTNVLLPRPGSCQASGCPNGQQCVFAGRYPCPDYIYSLECSCEPGCRVMNNYIPEGTTQQVDTCGNTCTCAREEGQPATGAARCTMLNCQTS